MNRAKRQRTKTFTGCWTCRSRRVKCDEQVPFCQRCNQFGVPCEGYGVRLSWVMYEADDLAQSNCDDDTDAVLVSRPRASRRTLGNIGESLAPRLSSPEIEAILKRIDDNPDACSETEEGVFSVFAVKTASPPVTGKPTSPESALEDVGQHVGLTDAADLVAFETSPEEQAPFSASANAHQVSGLQNSYHTIGSSVTHNQDASVALIDQSAAHQFSHHSSPSHLDLLRIPASQARLIHHWVTFTSGKLVLLDEPHNPCRTMMLPMALRGLTSSSQESTADIAIFHAICACAAYNLFELSGRTSEHDQNLAMKHDQEAIHHLRHNLAKADQHRDQSFAMAIMASITIEAISGTTCRWRTHVSGGLAYLGKLRSRGVDLEMSSAFQAHMVSMAIMCGCDVPTELKSFLHGTESLELSFPYYGASSSFLRAQDRMNTLAVLKTHPDTRELDAFELQLYLDFPAGTRDALPQTHATMVHHMAQAFYYASLVFFQRAVRRARIDSVQTLVENGVKQLEAIEVIGKGSAGSVMMWPALVLGAECGTPDLQRRMRAWFQVKRKLGFRNVVVLEELASSLWDRRNCGDCDVSWQDLIVEDRFDVFRL